MTTPWDLNAHSRHLQTLEGKDLSFSKVLVPAIIEVLTNLTEFASFSVLDVGCGTGILSHILSRYVDNVVGIDPSSRSVSIAMEYTRPDRNVTIECVGIENYFHHSSEFNFAVANMVLQAIDPLAPALGNIFYSLRHHGLLVLSIPHPCFWSMYKDEIAESGYSYNTASSYEITFTVTNDPNPLPCCVPYFHRPLEQYSSALYETGFTIERIIEPYPSQELMKQYARPWTYPHFLILVCRKKSVIEVRNEKSIQAVEVHF